MRITARSLTACALIFCYLHPLQNSQRILAFAAFAFIVLGLFEGEMIRFIFLEKKPIREYVTELPYSQFPGLRRFLREVKASTPEGATIGLWVPHAEADRIFYELAYHRAVYELEGRRVLPLLYRNEQRFLTENLRRVDFVACWHCAPPFPQMREVQRFQEGVLAGKR